jgi:hypothetical protein
MGWTKDQTTRTRRQRSALWLGERAAWVVLCGGMLLWAGCGDESEPAACEEDCIGGRAAVCDGATLVRFAAVGVCEDGTCRYPVQETVVCESGCDGGACIAPACVDTQCRTAPAPTCDGDFVVLYEARGACDAAGEVCEYPERSRTDCEANGQACVLGRCAERDACDEERCAEIPAPFCDGAVAVAAQTAGTCEPTPRGEACVRPEALRTDCAAQEKACVDGACVELSCEGTCEVPDPFCDGAVAVRPTGGAFCDTTTGTCAITSEERQNCTALEQFCVRGACVDEVIDCDGVVCDEPPANQCVSSVVLEAWGPAGICDDTTGACTYTSDRVRCAEDETCRDGACRENACFGVFCNEPPGATCEGTTRVRYAARGTCAGGSCSYPVDRTDCAATGRACLDGECVASCRVDGCPSAPASVCDGDEVTYFEGEGVCTAAGCVWSTSSLDCSSVDAVCLDGGCVPLCDGALCDDPPADFCSGTTAVRHPGLGTCNTVTGRCSYPSENDNCAIDDLVCIDGACVEDPCESLVCDVVPPRSCAGNTRIEYFAGGACIDGACQFPERRTDCTLTGATCLSGNCVGGCQPATCDEPPAPRCEGLLAVRFDAAGACVSGSCIYDRIEEDCSPANGACSGGFCIPGECPTGGCGDPPAPLCNGNIVVTYDAPLSCPFGACVWTETATPCPEETQCLDGTCVETNPCPGGCFTPPGPFCVGDTRRAPQSPGRCSLAQCIYDTFDDTDCADAGLVCRNGACVADPCDGVVCNTPDAPYCLGDTLQIPRAPGVCFEGTCRYFDEDEENCGAVENGICREGACIVQQPCTVTGCPVVPPFCIDDSTILRYLANGECTAEGKCDYDDVTEVEPCGEFERCANGACIPAPFPGTGLVLFSELMLTPGDGNRWVEITTAAEDPLPLAGLTLRIAFDPDTTPSTVVHTFGASAQLDPFGFWVVSEAAAPWSNETFGAWPAVWSRATFEILAGDGTLVTRVEFDEATWPGTTAGTSLQVRGAPRIAAQNDPTQWCPAAGFLGSPPRTPGSANAGCVGEVDE